MNRIDRAFQRRKQQDEAAIIFYLTAGYPNLETTLQVVDVLAEAGVDIIELGIPFSDPIADGPTIQHASKIALDGGVTLDDIFALTREIRSRHPELGLLHFGAYNPMFHYGDRRYVETAAEAGADGILIPDLPPEAATELREVAASRDLSTVFLVAPTTSPERIRLISDASTGFIYYISLRGVTGERTNLPTDLKDRVLEIKRLTDKPLAIGFGVSRPEHVRQVAAIADGVIIGSALIKKIGDKPNDPDRLDRVREFVNSITSVLAKSPSAR